MSLTYGFYNSINSDRKYNAQQLSSIFDGIIKDGVFMSIGTSLMVTSGSGMNINVGIGRAWFNKTWTDNDSILPLTVEQSEAVLSRIDAVVLEVNSSDNIRANSIKIIKGTPSTTPVAPTLLSTELIHQYPLSYIAVNDGITSITQGDITNKVGTSECPFITGILETINADTLLTQWGSEFNTWFNNLKDLLTTNAETNIINTINAHKADNSRHVPHLGITITSGSDYYTIATSENIVQNDKFTILFDSNSVAVPYLKINDYLAGPILKPNGSAALIHRDVPYSLFFTGWAFTLLGEGGDYGTVTANDVRNTVTFGTESGVIQGGLNLSNLIPSNIKKDVVIDGKTGTLIGITAGDQVLVSILPTWAAPPLTTFADSTPTKFLNGIQMYVGGTFRVKATVNGANYSGEHHKYQFYKNGVAFGSVFDFTADGNSKHTISQDFTCNVGDVITLYGWYIQTGSGSGFEMQDFQVCSGPPLDILIAFPI